MPALPEPISHTVAAMDAAIVAKARSFDGAGIAMSDVASPCDRAIWMKLRWTSPPEQPEGARERRFRTGHAYEAWLLDDLESTGAVVSRFDPTTGKQFRVELADGHLRGKMDGVAIGVPEAPVAEHVVECKSHKEDSYKAVVKKGLKDGKPDHYAQCQLYMHATGIARCLYLAANKNTDEVHAERLAYDPVYCLALVARLDRIVHAPRPLPKNESFACEWCKAKPQCLDGQFARSHCRTCIHCEPGPAASWRCVRWDKALSYRDQQDGCPAHRFIPDLVPGDQIDVIGDDVVVYRLASGVEWRDGEGR